MLYAFQFKNAAEWHELQKKNTIQFQVFDVFFIIYIFFLQIDSEAIFYVSYASIAFEIRLEICAESVKCSHKFRITTKRCSVLDSIEM